MSVKNVRNWAVNRLFIVVDVSDKSTTKSAIDNFIKDVDGIDIIIANAGISGKVDLESGNSDEINKMFSIKYFRRKQYCPSCYPYHDETKIR